MLSMNMVDNKKYLVTDALVMREYIYVVWTK